MPAVDLRRRAMFLGKRPTTVLRPPWALDDQLFIDRCARCDNCVKRCPQKILARGDGGYPEVDFTLGECTFCGECAAACTASAFRDRRESPWPYRAAVSDRCIARTGIFCQSCLDACEVRAIDFPRAAGIPQPRIDTARCNGCGACVSTCPVSAVKVAAHPEAL